MRESDSEAGSIDTYTGERFRPLDPDPETIRLEDIAQGLANTCRYSGQCRFFYSVGLHSLYVSEEVARDHGPLVQLYGLLHDASEAYLADVPGPVKDGFSDYQAAENRIQNAVWTAFDLSDPDETEKIAVKEADVRLLHYEADALIPTNDWTEPQAGVDYDLKADSQSDIPERFVERGQSLLREVKAA